MAIVGIICEYNPFHLGHASQMGRIRRELGGDTAIVCLMSGNYVQRGEPAIFDRLARARAAMESGANLVLEMPVTGSLSSAEGFAQKGVEILSPLCDTLCFGSETADADALKETAQALLDPAFCLHLKEHLKTGISFPAARARALEAMGVSGSPLALPNDILAVEYTKAILQQNSPMGILPIRRPGDYHATSPDPENPSATALRRLLKTGESWQSYVPQEAIPHFRDAAVHTLEAGERAILYRMRRMTDAEFEALPYGSEGLWRRLMHACREESSLEEIFSAVKTKRYTRTRLNRMVMCAYLEIDRETLCAPVPYTRILSFDDLGRGILNKHKASASLRPLGWKEDSPYARLETRCNTLYDLFTCGPLPRPDAWQQQRVVRISRPG